MLRQLSLVYSPRISDTFLKNTAWFNSAYFLLHLWIFWRTVIPCLSKVQKSPSFVSYLSNINSILSAVQAIVVSCLEDNFATNEANSIWRVFFDTHHPLLKSISICQEQTCLTIMKSPIWLKYLKCHIL